ncbi:MAG: neutral ceramidase [Pirellulaceae bacterium]|jgi:neutral ceramidase
MVSQPAASYNHERPSSHSVEVTMRRCLISLVALPLLLLIPDTIRAERDWNCGVAKVNITPRSPMWMSGYASRNHPAEGTLTKLWAKAVVLQIAQEKRSRMVLVTLDLLGIDRALSQRIRDRICKTHRLEYFQVHLACSHTHTGPIVAGNLRPMHYMLLDETAQKQVDDYAKFLEECVAEAVATAYNNNRYCTLEYGVGKATFAVNRRNNPENDVASLRQTGKLVGPFDHDVPVLIAKYGKKPAAIIFGYACHATVLSFYRWSGDYPGFAQIEVEKQFPDCIAMFWAGCGGDQNPLPRRKVELAQQYGKQLADAVGEVVNGKTKNLTRSVESSYEEIDLPLGNLPTREELEQNAQSKNKYEQSRAKHLLKVLDREGKLPQTYPYPIGKWILGGEVEWIFLGGEVTIDYAVRLKLESKAVSTWVTAYTDDVMAYIPSRRVLGEGGYEGATSMIYYGLPTTWSPEIEEAIIKAALKQPAK